MQRQFGCSLENIWSISLWRKWEKEVFQVQVVFDIVLISFSHWHETLFISSSKGTLLYVVHYPQMSWSVMQDVEIIFGPPVITITHHPYFCFISYFHFTLCIRSWCTLSANFLLIQQVMFTSTIGQRPRPGRQISGEINHTHLTPGERLSSDAPPVKILSVHSRIQIRDIAYINKAGFVCRYEEIIQNLYGGDPRPKLKGSKGLLKAAVGKWHS